MSNNVKVDIIAIDILQPIAYNLRIVYILRRLCFLRGNADGVLFCPETHTERHRRVVWFHEPCLITADQKPFKIPIYAFDVKYKSYIRFI